VPFLPAHSFGCAVLFPCCLTPVSFPIDIVLKLYDNVQVNLIWIRAMHGWCQIVFALVCKFKFSLPATWEECSTRTSLEGKECYKSEHQKLWVLLNCSGTFPCYFAKVGSFEGNKPWSPNRAEICFTGLSRQCGFTHQEIVSVHYCKFNWTEAIFRLHSSS
jgi:hypothetical protein